MHDDDTRIPEDIGALAVAMLPVGARILAWRDTRPTVATVEQVEFHPRTRLYWLTLADDAGHRWQDSYRGDSSPRLIAWPAGWDDDTPA